MNMIRVLWGKIRLLFVSIFGRFSWTLPTWPGRLNGFRRNQPRRFLLRLVAVLAVPLICLTGYLVYKSIPQPLYTDVTIMPPGITPPVEPLVPGQLEVQFTLHSFVDANGPHSNAAARLDLVGKPVPDGITMQPAMPGKWVWSDDNTLSFKPDEDWPAGQQYSLSFDKSIFAPHVKLEKKHYTFTTPDISDTLEKLAFYQDPVNPKIHEVVATISFTHPVDTKSFEKNVSLTMRPSGSTIDIAPEHYHFSVKYNKLKREAYITSDPITLPDRENYMTLSISDGVKAAYGPSKTQNSLKQQVLIPDVTSYFRVDSLDARIVRDDKNRPQQTLIVNFTDGIKSEDLARTIHAYLLPEKQFHSWAPREVTGDVLAKSQLVKLDSVPTEHDFAMLQSFRMDVPEGRQIYVRIDAGLESHGEYVMSRPYDTVLYAPDYPKEVHVQAQGAVLSLNGARTLSFMTRGVPAIRVQIAQLLPGEIAHLISQTSGDFSDPYFENYNFGENDITARHTRIIQLDNKSPKDAVYAALDLSDYLPHDSGSRGMFFITADGWDPVNKQAIDGAHDRRFILVTDLGLVVKDNLDKSHDVFVQSVSSGTPVEGAQVALLGKNGLPVFTGVTDSRGHLQLPATSGLHDEKKPTVYLVHRGNDYSFIPFNRPDRQINLSNFDVGGVYIDPHYAADALDAYVFSDRGIYRPGDTAHLGIIVKRRDWGSITGVPVEVEIDNPLGARVLKKKFALDQDGLLDISYTPDTAAPTGEYHASVFLLGKNDVRRGILGSTDIKVEEFLPDTMRIRTHISGQKPAGWVLPKDLSADVHLENLFGTPAQDRHVAAGYTLIPTTFHFKNYPEFIFDDPFLNTESRPQTVNETLPAGQTDDKGNATFKLDLSQYTRGLYRLVFSAQGFAAAGGRSVSSSSSTLVSPLPYLVGHKADGQLQWLDLDSTRSVQFLAVDPTLKSVSVSDLTLKLSEERYVSTLVQQNDGTYQYQSVKKVTLVKSSPFALKRGGNDYTLPTDRPGTFIAELFDKDSDVLARVRYSVAGNRNTALKLEKNAELKVNLKGQDFKPGDDIALQITAPYTGAGLITIERDHVYAFHWFKTSTTTSIQHITVPQGIEGNAYVNVTFVRSLDSKEIFTSPLSYAVVPFTIDRSARTINIKLDVPAKIKPDDTLTVHYQTSRPGRIVLFAVDEGILQVAHYSTPSPLDDFLQKRALQVTTSQIADQILPEYSILREISSIGGDEAARAALGHNLNPFRRKTQKPVAYWSGIMDSDGQPSNYTFHIPDYFNGNVRVMAVAVNDNAMGAGDAHTLVRGPFVIMPNVLTSAAPGDTFEVGVGVSNDLENIDKPVTVTLQAKPGLGLEITGNSTAKFMIAPGSEAHASFHFTARNKLGSTDITFIASAAGVSSHLTSTLSVRPSVPYYTWLDMDVSNSGSANVKLARELYPEFSTQEAYASSSPLILVRGLENYIAGYPYGCSEQIVSKVFPFLGFANDPVYKPDLKNFAKDYAALITKLRARQQSDGGFSYWPGETDSSLFVSLYVMHFLTDAKDQGYPVPLDMLSQGLGYLQQEAENNTDTLDDARKQAYAIYLLTRNGTVTTNYLTHLQESLQENAPKSWHKDLTAIYMAASYKLLQHDDLAEQLVTGYAPETDPGAYYDWYDTSLGRSAQYLYLIARHFPQRLAHLPDSVLGNILSPVFAGDYNTLSSAYSIISLGEYSKAVAAMEHGHIEISVRDRKDNTRLLASADKQQVTATIPLDAVQVDLASRGIQKLFYTVSQAGFDTQPPDKAVSKGIEVIRQYTDAQGNVVTSATLGSNLTVHIKIRTTDGRSLNNVAILDLLPAGFEVQRDSIRNDSGDWHLDYSDIREDRVVFYGSFGPEAHEITYTVKATSPGTFIVPAIYAGAMYDRSAFGHSASGRFTVNDLK